MLRRLLLAAFVLTSLAGCLDTHDQKVYVRRVPPTKEELAARPPESYEERLRRDDALEQRLAVPHDLRDHTAYLDAGRKGMTAAIETPLDPWASFEADRIRVIQSRDWADVGKAPPPEVFPKSEPPVEEDPFAPVQKMGKKPEANAGGDQPDAGAGGDKPADKPAGDKPADAPKGDDTGKN